MNKLNINIRENLVFALMVLFVLTLPFKESINSISIILLTFTSIYIYFTERKIDQNVLSKLLPFILFFVLAGISLLYSSDRNYAFIHLQRLLPFLVFPLVFSIIKMKKESYLKLAKIFSFWMILLALYSHTKALLKLLNNNDRLYNFFLRDYSYLNLSTETIGLSATHYSYFILTSTIFITYFFFFEKRKIYKVLYILILFYLTFFIFHLSIRNAIAALFVFFNFSIVYFFYLKKNILKSVIYLILLYVITGIIGYNVRVTRYRFQHLFGFTYSSGIRHDDGIDKLKQWKAAVEANQNVLFGNGIGDANTDIYRSYRESGLDKFADRKYNAHNQFIQTYVEMGIIGILLLLFIFYNYFNLFYKNAFFIGASFLIISFILFQSESYLQRHKGIVLFSFIIMFFTNYLLTTDLNGKANSNNNHKK